MRILLFSMPLLALAANINLGSMNLIKRGIDSDIGPAPRSAAVFRELRSGHHRHHHRLARWNSSTQGEESEGALVLAQPNRYSLSFK